MSSDVGEWSTAIAQVQHDDVLIRGYALTELIGKITYMDSVFLVHTGELPTSEQRQMMDAMYVSLIEHGISPTTIIARTLASCGTPSQASLAGAMLSIADWHGGSGEQLGELLAELVDTSSDDDALRVHAAELVAGHRAQRRRFEGFGHPQHPDADPRAMKLFSVAEATGVAGRHVTAARLLEEEIERSLGRRLALNVTGAIAAIFLDLGFSWMAIRGMVIAARSAGLVAHVVEEREQGGTWRHVPADRVTYTGSPERVLDSTIEE
ncbi:citryl-CoA lyase [Ilumatobacter sp.]|uniref:citryl-CoA lyase n=1 Tax=Ilumatobacter sp. TaxID=1967498 RepID=UPI003751BCA1